MFVDGLLAVRTANKPAAVSALTSMASQAHRNPLVDPLVNATIRALMMHNSASFARCLSAVLSLELSALPAAQNLAVAPYPPGICRDSVVMRGLGIRDLSVNSGACACHVVPVLVTRWRVPTSPGGGLAHLKCPWFLIARPALVALLLRLIVPSESSRPGLVLLTVPSVSRWCGTVPAWS